MQIPMLALVSDGLSSEISVPPVPGRPVVFGQLVLDPVACDATAHGIAIGLSAAEFATLGVLVAHRDTPLSREAIAAGLAERGLAVVPRMIDVYICRIRQKLAAVDLGTGIITAWGRGYRMGHLPRELSAPLDPIGGDNVAGLLPA